MMASRLLIGLLLACVLLAAASAAVQAPNVLFIAVDDMRAEHGVYGGQAITPNIDAFAKTATLFKRNYVQVGVCSPSRASLLTGRYADTTHITDLWHYFRTFGCNVTTLPQAFKNAGYLTAGSGKIFHPGHASGAGEYVTNGGCPGCKGYNDPPSWNEYNIPSSNEWREQALDETQYPISMHPDTQTAEYIIGLLKSAAASGKPFFLAPGFYKPHLPFIFPARFLDLYDNVTSLAPFPNPPVPPMANDSWTGWSEVKTYQDIAAIVTNNNLEQELKAPCNAMPAAKALELRKAYFSAVSYNDYVVGLVLDALTELGLENTTNVVLWGDHGWQLGDHGDWGKHENFEDTTRAPLLIRAPAFPQSYGAVVSEAFTEHVDIYPTLLQLAGLPADDTLQGVSLVPLLDTPTLPQIRSPNAAYSQYPAYTEPCVPPENECSYARGMGYSIRTDTYRYTYWTKYNNVTHIPSWEPVPKREYIVELYNHTGDIGDNWEQFENSNIVSEAPAKIVSHLDALLKTGPNLLSP